MSTLKKYFVIGFYCLLGVFIPAATAQSESQGLFDQESPLKMAVFEYLIANTDWSVEHLQNIKLLRED